MKKKAYIEFMRVFSMIAVILIHIFVTARTSFEHHKWYEEYISVVISHILHFAVPVFFMITGALFLQKSKEIAVKILYKKYILKYMLTILSFGWIYALMEIVFTNKTIRPVFILRSFLNMVQGNTWEHMWYLYTLIGILIILPIIKTIVNSDKNENHILRYTLIVLMCNSFIIKFCEGLLDVKIGINIPISSEFIVYMILGYLIDTKKIQSKKKLNCITILVSVATIIILDFLNIKYGMGKLQKFGDYNSPIILIMSLAIFLNSKEKWENTEEIKCKMIKTLSQDSFGIYIIHMFWINLLYKLIGFNIYGKMLFFKVVFAFTFTLILSFVMIEIMKRVPFFKKIL